MITPERRREINRKHYLKKRTPEFLAERAKARREWRKANPEKAKLQARRDAAKYLYGLTLEQVENLKAQRGYHCDLCGRVADKLCLDHNHRTGLFRGILCDSCNRGIGLLGDSVDILRRAEIYLSRG